MEFNEEQNIVETQVTQEDTEALLLSGVYEHFKGGLYSVVCTALNSEDLRKTVVYQSLEDGKIWVRDFEEFIGEKETEEGTVKRFNLIGFEDASLFVED
jgi:hypothetical protein